ncbi:MAG: Glu/Leu/Phe/Val dehydrogenase [Chlamydiales bacterium]|nr:Glu/Leu/Phe/Val dehydrogenase [Chlamydiales bacterium]
MGILAELTFNEIKVEGFERVIEVINEAAGLHAIIALHNTTLGPALGGVRAYPYPSFEDALKDVLRLSKGMTYKASVAETGTGGGKSVIICDSRKPKSEELLLAFAEAVNALEGNYICAEDVGMRVDDLAIIRKGTPYAVGLPHLKSSGDPSRFTAYGGFLGVRAAAKKLWGVDSLKGRCVAIQGLGSVGMRLADHLFWDGARLLVTDIDEAAVQRAVREYAAIPVSPDDIFEAECDIFAPCALGGILNPDTIPLLRCKGIAGLANNQLLTEADGQALMNRGILYSPDYVINSGGLLNVCVELHKEGYNPSTARLHIERIYDLLLKIYTLSEEKRLPANIIANDLADSNLKQGSGKRTEPVIFHH